MKAEKLLFLPLLFSVGLCAQNEGQRLEIQKSNNKTELLQLKSAFQAQHDQDEIAVNKYLATNRLVQRTFEKDGSVYFLKSIDRDGNPVYINTKSNIGMKMNKEHMNFFNLKQLLEEKYHMEQ